MLKLAKFMFILQKEPTPVWVVASRDEEKGFIVKSKEEFCSDIENLYDKYRPQFENPLYQTFYDFVVEVICKGLSQATIQRIFLLISELSTTKLRQTVTMNMLKIADFLAASEGDDESDYIKELSKSFAERVIEPDRISSAAKRKNTGTDIAAGALEQNCLLNEEFQYFEKVYQGECLDQFTETQRKPLAMYAVGAIVVQPFPESTASSKIENSETRKQSELPNIECLSEIEGEMGLDDVEVRVNRHPLERSQSIVIVEKYLAPILVKEMKTETQINEEFKKVVEEFQSPNAKNIGGGTDRTATGREYSKSHVITAQAPVQIANNSTKSSLRRKRDYKIEYQNKIKMGMLLARAKPYQLRRKS